MVCPDCGAEPTGREQQCPYCGWENPAIAEKAHQAELHSIYRKCAELLHLPERMVRKIGKWLAIAVGTAVAVYLLVLLGAWATTGLRQELAYQRQQETLARLEAYYIAEDYARMGEYLEKAENSYSATFSKYRVIDGLRVDVDLRLDWLDTDLSFDRKFLTGETVAAHIEALTGLLKEIDALEVAGFVYGEEAAALHFRGVLTAALKERLCLTEDEIASAKQWPGDSEEMDALAEACRERLWEEAFQ